MKKILTALTTSAILSFLCSNKAQAITFVENNAGDTLATAQVIPSNGSGGSIVPSYINIQGVLDSASNVDMFKLYLTGNQTFSAQVVTTGTSVIDSRLYLFDSTGKGVEANDDIDTNNGNFLSELPSGGLSPSTSGFYYLAVTTTDNDALNLLNNPIFDLSSDPSALVAPSASPAVLNNWAGTTGEVGTYNIALTGVQIANQPVPEPNTIGGVLLGLGLAYLNIRKISTKK
jgi:hypothetical protein